MPTSSVLVLFTNGGKVINAFPVYEVDVSSIASDAKFSVAVRKQLLVLQDSLVIGTASGYGRVEGDQVLVQNAPALPQYGTGLFRVAEHLCVGKSKGRGATVLRYDPAATISRDHALVYLKVDASDRVDLAVDVPQEWILGRYAANFWRNKPSELYLLLLIPVRSRLCVEGETRPHPLLRELDADDPEREAVEERLNSLGYSPERGGTPQTLFVVVRANGEVVAGDDAVTSFDQHDDPEDVTWR